MAEKEKKGKAKAALVPRAKSDDFTGQYKEEEVVWAEDLPEPFKAAFNDAWNQARTGKPKLFYAAIDAMLAAAQGTAAESAPFDVYCKKVKIYFGEAENTYAIPMCLLSFCGFHERLEFMKSLLENKANVDSGTARTGSPLLQMMTMMTARGKAAGMEYVRLLVEEYPTVLSRVITSGDKPPTFQNASVLNLALHMKDWDLAKYFFKHHNLHPIYGGSRDFPPIFVEYMQYGTFNFIPWLVADGLPTKPETDELVEAFIQPEVLGAPGVVAAEQRTGRCAAHTIMLCALRRPLTSFCDKRPDLIRAVDSFGRNALSIAAEHGLKKPVQMFTECYGELMMYMKDYSGILPVLAGAKNGNVESVRRILLFMLKDDALIKKPSISQDLKLSGLTAIKEGYITYFETLHKNKHQVQVLLLPLDVLGNTAAHLAAMKGKEEFFMKILPHSIADKNTILTAKNVQGRTPLQVAIDKGHANIFTALHSLPIQWRETWREHNDPLLLYVCVRGNVELVRAIMQLGSAPDISSPKGRTPLSCAAEAGNDEIVSYLLSYRHTLSDGTVIETSPEGSRRNGDKYSPLMLAAANGHAKVCKRLLNKSAKVNQPRHPDIQFTPLMVAIDEGNRDVVITILSDRAQGMEAMKVCAARQDSRDGLDFTTPMRMLIEKMPDVAEWLMNRCINQREEVDVGDDTGLFAFPEAGRDAVVEYNFQFLEDFADECSRFPGMRFFRKKGTQQGVVYRHNVQTLSFDLTNGSSKADEMGGAEVDTSLDTTPPDPQALDMMLADGGRMDMMFDELSSNEKDAPVLVSDDTEEGEGRGGRRKGRDWRPNIYRVNCHTLNIMVKNHRIELLKHPLVTRLIEYKWRRVAFPLFIGYIAVYLLFLALLTTFAMVSPRPGPESEVCSADSLNSGLNILKTNGTCNDISLSEDSYLYGSAVLIILLSVGYLAIELVQILRRKLTYLTDGANYVQLLTFLFTIIYVSGFGNECWCTPNWQWQVGALALFLAWFNLVILLKDMPFAGIPINMLFNIFLSFMCLIFLPILLIVAFALPFYMLFVRNVDGVKGDDAPGVLRAFFSPSRALVKTIMQTAGELDFETIFNEADLVYSPVAYLLFITFVVVMPILFSNLLVGLAVGDTEEERKKASFTKTKLQVDFILELEDMSSFLRGQMRPRGNRLRYAQKTNKLRQKLLEIRGLDYDTQVELCKELDEQDEEFIDALKEAGPIYEVQKKVEGLVEKTMKVEEDVRSVKGEVVEVKERLSGRLKQVESDLKDIKSLLKDLVKAKKETKE